MIRVGRNYKIGSGNVPDPNKTITTRLTFEKPPGLVVFQHTELKYNKKFWVGIELPHPSV